MLDARLVYEQLRLYDLKNNIVFNTFSRELLLELKALQQPDEKFEYGLLYKGEYSPWKLGLIAFFSPLECYDAYSPIEIRCYLTERSSV